MNDKRDVVVVAYGRTPSAKAKKGSLANTHPVEFAAQALNGVLGRLPGLDPALIEDVVVGAAFPEEYEGYNIARIIAQHAGLPDSVPGMTINRFCASGLQAVSIAANAIASSEMDIVVAGGCESMSKLSNILLPEPYRLNAVAEKKPGTYMSMGMTAENVADKYHITREEMEALAVDSHRKAAEALKEKRFDDHIIPVKIVDENGNVSYFDQDEGVRPGTSAETLAKLKPCFKEDGLVTAATSSQTTDGAAFLVLMARETAEKMGFRPIARFRGFAVTGVPSDLMGIGPIEAVPRILRKTGLTIDDIDVVEINEAFASQSVACIRELGIPYEKVNPNGGAMALGHPLGATGAILSCRLLSELARTGKKRGLVTMCIGGGMGAAGIYEME